MSGNSAPDAPKHFSNIRRTRPSYSCENCRARRVKCDQIHPQCGNCVRNQVDCIYTTSQPKRKSGCGQDLAASAARKAHREHDNNEGAEHAQQGYLVTQAGGRSRYIEKTFWASVDSEGLELDSLLSDLPIFPEDDDHEDEDDIESSVPLNERGPSNFWMSQNHTHNAKVCPKQLGLLRRLPPEQTCVRLYNVFLEGVHPLIPLIHITSFENSFKRFWEWYDTWDRQAVTSGILIENPSFLSLLLAVLFTGSLARTGTSDIANNPLDAPDCATTELYKMTLASLTFVSFPQNPGLHSLMAYVLVNAMLIREEEALSSCSFVALSIRIAQAMGLHKDGSSFKLDAVQVEERRRLWAQLMHLDVMTACFSGLPLVASGEMYSNTKMMSELRDEFIGGSKANTVTVGAEQDKYPGYLLALGRYQASTMMRKILLRQFSPDPLRLVHIKSLAEQIETLKSQLNTRSARLKVMEGQPTLRGLAAELVESDLHPNPNGGSYSTALVGWSINLLELMVEKASCVLYQPIISDAHIWHEVRTDAIPHYQNYIEIYLRMSTSQVYRPFQWLYPQSYQPLHPTAVLLIDCMKENSSAEMIASTNIIRRIFSLAGPQGRITNGSVNTEHGMSQFRPNKGANRAWDRLEKLRSRVWNRLGLSHVDLDSAHSSSSDPLPGQAHVKVETANEFTPLTNAQLLSRGFANLGSPDGLLFDELQRYFSRDCMDQAVLFGKANACYYSFSQSWYPNAFYSIQDSSSELPGFSAQPINFMMPEVTPYHWTLDAATQSGVSDEFNNDVPDSYQS